MGHRTVTFKGITALPARKRKPVGLPLSKLDDGSDFLDLCSQVAGTLQDDPRVEKGNYTKVLSANLSRRDLLITVETGTIGAAAHVRDTANDSVSYTLTPSDAPVVSLRCLIYVPTGSRLAFACLEHSDHKSSGTMLLKEIKAEWISRHSNLTLHMDTLVKPDEWLKAAELESVTAVIRDHAVDIAEGGRREKIGTIRHSLVPDQGSAYLPRWIKQRIMDNKKSTAATLGLAEDTEIDELVLKLADDDSSKTFVVGRERTPSIRLLLSAAGQPALTDEQFVQQCHQECDRLTAKMA